MSVDFSKFKEKLNTKQIEEMEKEHSSKGGQYREVPSGIYPVSIENLELQSRDGNYGHYDQINIDFKILDVDPSDQDDGYYPNNPRTMVGQHIFYNGTFNNKVDSGYRATARLLSELTDGNVDEDSILFNITKGIEDARIYITDLFQALAGNFEYDLSYELKEQKDINPNTGKPYKPNRFFSVVAVYDVD